MKTGKAVKLFGKRFINKFFKQIKILKAIICLKKTTTQPLNDNPLLKALLDTWHINLQFKRILDLSPAKLKIHHFLTTFNTKQLSN